MSTSCLAVLSIWLQEQVWKADNPLNVRGLMILWGMRVAETDDALLEVYDISGRDNLKFHVFCFYIGLS